MDFNRIISLQLVADSRTDIEARCGCIVLKGVLHHYVYDNGYESDMVEMTAPYPGRKRALFDHKVNVVLADDSGTPEAIALKKIYRQELEIRRRQRYLERNKARIAELLPMWFEYDARMGYLDAAERTERRMVTREARKGEISVKEINKCMRYAREAIKRHRQLATHEHSLIVNRELRRCGLQSLEFGYGDSCRLFGDDIWERLLVRAECRVECEAVVDDVLFCLFNDFAQLYNIALPKFEVGDKVESIGFGDEILAVTLCRNDVVVGVGAIDDVRGRRALRALVDDDILAEILPKKVYNAVTRHESFYVRGALYYHRQNRDKMITIY